MTNKWSRMAGLLVLASIGAVGTIAAQDSAAQEVAIPSLTLEGRHLELRGILHRPSGEGPFPALVLLYGSEGMTHAAPPAVEQHAQWVERIAAWGYVALELDSASPRGRDSNDDFVKPSVRSHDAYAAKSYLSKLPFVDPGRVGVIGWSHGAIAALSIIDAAYPRETGANPFQAAVAFYPICHRLLRPDTPLLVLTGRKDDISLASLAESLEADSKKANWKQEFSVAIYPNATHAFDFEGLAGGYDDPYGHHLEYDPEAAADAIGRTKDFFAKYVGGR
jgi:dienelactone hydrolase